MENGEWRNRSRGVWRNCGEGCCCVFALYPVITWESVPVIGDQFCNFNWYGSGRWCAGEPEEAFGSPGGNPVYIQVCVAGGIAGIWHEFGKRAGNRRESLPIIGDDLRVAGGCVLLQKMMRVSPKISTLVGGVINLRGIGDCGHGSGDWRR